jgi:hypothetical protein
VVVVRSIDPNATAVSQCARRPTITRIGAPIYNWSERVLTEVVRGQARRRLMVGFAQGEAPATLPRNEH